MSQQATPIAVPAVGLLLFLAFGTLCTFYLKAVQRWATSAIALKLNPAMRIRSLRQHVESKVYSWELRVIGLLSLGAAGLILYAMLTWPPRP